MNTKKSLNPLAIIAALALLLPAFAWATYPAEVARTGQTTCYDASGAVIACAGTGQDGAIQAGAVWPDPRFTNRGDGTVLDNLTGLVWALNANLPNGSKTWQAALDYVAGMNAGTNPNLGYTDWRLPNINELESLVNAELYDPALPQGHPFTNVQSFWYWSSTSYVYTTYYTYYAWLVDMVSGSVFGHDKTISHYVWPVRSGQCGALGNSVICLPKTGQTLCYKDNGTETDCAGTGQDGELQKGVAWPSPRFVDNGDGTVTDSLTGLEWTKNPKPAFAYEMTWQQALVYVAQMNRGIYPNLGYLGYTDWRLPNERELRSLTDYSKFNPALPSGHPFTNVLQSTGYDWSSTSNARYANWAWYVDRIYGSVHSFEKTTDYVDFRLVRAGQVGNPVISTTTKNDFNGDGNSDILLKNAAGSLYVLFGKDDGVAYGVPARIYKESTPATYTVVGTGDFNGDGNCDILLKNAAGSLYVLFGKDDGVSYATTATRIYKQTSPATYSVVGTGDFNGDGNDDVLLKNANGSLYVLFGKDDGVSYATTATRIYKESTPATYSVVGTGDFNGDGNDDVLLKNANGSLYVLFGKDDGVAYANTATRIYKESTPATYSVVGTGDFNGDGNTDVLLKNAAGSLYVLAGKDDGVAYATTATRIYKESSPATYSVVLTGDYNGDGNTDVLLKNAAGSLYVLFGKDDGVAYATTATRIYKESTPATYSVVGY